MREYRGNRWVIWCHIMHCQPSQVIKIECATELQKDEIVRMIELQDLCALLIDHVEEIVEGK